MTGNAGKDHSSAAMIALLGGHLREWASELVPDWMPSADFLDNGRVDIDAKRRLIRHVMDHDGAGLLISVGESMHHIQHLPIADVLLMSRDTDNLAMKWQRLERYVHSRHQTRIELAGPRRWQCRHVSITDSRPEAGEDLLVCGLIIGVLREFGCIDIRVRMDGQDWAAEDLKGFALPGETADWSIYWRDRQAPEGRDCALIGRLGETRLAVGEAAPCARYIAEDLGAPQNIATTARDLGRSTRTLQRELSRSGFTFSSLTRGIRVEAATGLLTESDMSLAGIGFVCGFSDQAHFQRDFKRVMGMTPGQYRDNLVDID